MRNLEYTPSFEVQLIATVLKVWAVLGFIVLGIVGIHLALSSSASGSVLPPQAGSTSLGVHSSTAASALSFNGLYLILFLGSGIVQAAFFWGAALVVEFSAQAAYFAKKTELSAANLTEK